MPKLQENPIVWIGGYTLQLYCKYDNINHSYGEFPHEFVGHRREMCMRIARSRGWIIHKDGTTTCPKCVKELEK